MKALYNEIDPFAAAWMRNLIADGHIAPGVVDERSIENLTPADVAGPGQRHFFAGIGGWSYALRLAGIADDADVWTGSCPCQPFSAAGKRGGTSDARHLWPAWFALIRECRPATIFGEQVASSDGLAWLDIVSSDLERCGYAVGAADLCAAGVGAPHIRQRLYFVAYAGRERRKGKRLHVRERRPGTRLPETGGAAKLVGDASSSRSWRNAGAVSNAQASSEGTRLVDRRERDESVNAGPNDQSPTYWCDGTTYAAHNREIWCRGALADASGYERGSWRRCSEVEGTPEHERAAFELAGRGDVNRGLGDSASRTGFVGIRGGQNAQDLGRPSSRPPGERDVASGVFDHWCSVEWVGCTDGKRRPIPTEPGLQPLAPRVPIGLVVVRAGDEEKAIKASNTLKGSGNAIVPQCAAAFIVAAEQARSWSR